MNLGGGFRGASIAALWVTMVAGSAVPAEAATVTKTADSNDGVCNADCSLREAIATAPPGDTVIVPASTNPYLVTDGLDSLLVEKDLTIAGAGARQTELNAPGTLMRVLTIRSTGAAIPTVTVRDLTISGGNGFGAGFGAEGGGVLAIRPGAASDGPKVLLDRVRVTANTASFNGAATAVGGGVAADGVGTGVTVRDSLLDSNQAVGTGGAHATGGAIATFAGSAVSIENTTITANQARSDATTAGRSALAGGAFLVNASSLLNVTLSANSALRSTPAALVGIGGNLQTANSVTVANTVIHGGVADQAGTGDCAGPFSTQSQGGNVLPAECGPGPADRTSADPLLGGLTDNGGPTDTQALLAGSPAIDAASGCPPPSADQRGLPRPQGAACDAGAFEVQTVPPAGAETPTCQGKAATIVGTAGKDKLKGTKGADVIAALAGNDSVSALAGNDRVCAGDGKDKVSGGGGKDRINGENGADVLRGGGGNDKLKGGKGKDKLLGQGGTAKLNGGPGRDVQTQ